MKPKKKLKLLNTMIIKKKLDEMTKQFVLLNHHAKNMNDNEVETIEIDEVYLQMAELYVEICNLVNKELREQNPSLNSLFDCLLHLRNEMN